MARNVLQPSVRNIVGYAQFAGPSAISELAGHVSGQTIFAKDRNLLEALL